MSMKDPSPSLQEWAALYQAAADFKNIAAWNWMYDSDLFGVRNPSNGEVGYCCVMGNLGEHYALGVYLGTEGLEGYLQIQSGAFDPPDISALHVQKCLMASFEDREFLEQQDRNLIKDLGLKFRGRNAWPLFRSYRPGYHPWFLTRDEARFLTIALQQAIDVALRFKDNADLLTPPREGLYLVRSAEQQEGSLDWSDRWLAPAPSERAAAEVPHVDELRVQRIRQAITARQGAWEADFFFAPTAVQEHRGERPYYPYMSLWVDRRSGFIMHTDMTEARVYRGEFQNQFLALIEQARGLPKEVYVKRQEAFDLLEPIAKRLGIALKRTRSLPMLDSAHQEMLNYFERF